VDRSEAAEKISAELTAKLDNKNGGFPPFLVLDFGEFSGPLTDCFNGEILHPQLARTLLDRTAHARPQRGRPERLRREDITDRVNMVRQKISDRLLKFQFPAYVKHLRCYLRYT